MTIGVYAVINKHNRKSYVGSSANVERRLVHHRSYIKTKLFLHYQGYDEDAIKYGVDGFEFKLLKQTDTVEEAKELETAFLECFIDDLYNKAPNANGSTGVQRERNAYVAGAAKRLQNPDYTKKLSEACKGKRVLLTCPHCGLTGGGGNMRRYHMDNCRDKK
jgi:group I intron endonuclease